MTEDQQRLALRAGAGTAIAGALLGTLVNLAHGDLSDDPEVALTRVASTTQWSLLHLGIILSVLLVLIAILGLSRAASGDRAQLLARTAAALALPGAAISVIVTAIDGIATKAMADAWARAASAAGSATDPAQLFGDAVAVEAVQNALFHAEAAFFFGLPFLLLGLATQLPGGGLPRRSGWLAVLGGGGAFVFGLTGLAGGELPGLLFNGFAGLITLWALVTGILVWRRPPAPTTAELRMIGGPAGA